MHADCVRILDNRVSNVSCRSTLRKVRQNYANSPMMTIGMKCLQLRPIPDDGNIATFMGKTFIENGYRVGNSGHFNAKYLPQDKKLNIGLPVFFRDGFPEEKAKYFIDNVKETWSEKYNMQTNVDTPEWKSALNDVDVFVQAEKAANEGDAYFKLQEHSGGSYVRDNDVSLRDSAYEDTQKAKRGEVGSRGYKLNVYGHETGHMLGLGDEYIASSSRKGDHATHYDLTKEALGEDEANCNATKDVLEHRDRSIMGYGPEVKKHHYVTFWAAMVQAIQGGSPDSTKAPNQRSDWKIV